MSIHFYLGTTLLNQPQEFLEPYEKEGVRRICNFLWQKLALTKTEYALIANPRRLVTGREVTPDLVLISETGMGVLEMKGHFGLIRCDEPLHAWWAGPKKIEIRDDPGQPSPYQNPHQQVQDYARQIRSDFTRYMRDYLLRDYVFRENAPWIQTSVCFTNTRAVLTKAKKTVQDFYTPESPLEGWEKFKILAPSETPEWATDLSFGINLSHVSHYQPFGFTPSEIRRVASDFFCAAEWRDMEQISSPDPLPYAYLNLIESSKPLLPYRLNQPEMLIGRRAEVCQIVIPGKYKYVSRTHARILNINGEIYVEDLGSRFGTFIDGRPIQRERLKSASQQITLGGSTPGEEVCLLQFSLDEPPQDRYLTGP